MDALARRKARAAERKRLQQRDAKRKTQRKLLFAALAVALVVTGVIFLVVSMVNSALSASAAAAEEEAVALEEARTNNPFRSPKAAIQLALQPFSQFYFYEEERSQRYLDFQLANPDMSAEQVVVRVNVDLDKEVYSVVTPTPEPDSILALVGKHFSLPYDYEPANLTSFGDIHLRTEVIGPLGQMLEHAQADGLVLSLSSGYRSAPTQEGLYSGYVDILGNDWAEAQSSRPCHSEHQLGLVIDFGPTDYQFYGTSEAYWLKEHAHEHGFIVRYTEENSDITLYIHEPWHIRYVGEEAAAIIHKENIGSFEEYWVKYVQHSPKQ